MKRRTTNLIRFVMDECLPPIIRDNKYFMLPFYYLAYGGRNVRSIMDFKARVPHFSAREYEDFYAGLNSISRNRETDLNRPCIDRILELLDDRVKTLVDVGCGNGHLLRRIAEYRPDMALCACDVIANVNQLPFPYIQSDVQALELEDRAYDVVTCCHTLEHIPELKQAVRELKRVCSGKLLLVVPRQRYFYYTLDEHIHFFTHRHQLFSLMGLQETDVAECRQLAGDWLLVIDCRPPAALS